MSTNQRFLLTVVICTTRKMQLLATLSSTTRTPTNRSTSLNVWIYKPGQSKNYITGPGGACRPTPSRDGKSIAFVRRVGAKTGLHVFDIESGAVRLIYDELERDMQEAWAIHGVYPAIAWTPDGQHIIAYAKGKIRKISTADGGSESFRFASKTNAKFVAPCVLRSTSPQSNFQSRCCDGCKSHPVESKSFFQSLGYLYVRDLPDGIPRRLTSQTEHFEFYPSYSRDGRHLVYTTWNDEKLGSVRIASANPDDAESWKVIHSGPLR